MKKTKALSSSIFFLSLHALLAQKMPLAPIPCPNQAAGENCQITVKKSLTGLIFSAPDALFGDLSCDDGKLFFYALATLLKKREGGENPLFQNYVQRCKTRFDPLLAAQWQLKLSPKTSPRALEIKQHLQARPHFAQWMALFGEALELPQYFPKEKDRLARSRTLLKQMAPIKSNFWRHWPELALSLHTSNTGWMHKLVRQILATGRTQIFFHPLGGRPSESDQNKMHQLFVNAIQKFVQKSGDARLGRMISGKMAEFSGLKSRSPATPYYDNWTLSELRAIGKKGPMVRRYFDFWYSKYLGRTAETERKIFLQQILSVRSIKEAHPSQLWVFADDLPAKAPLHDALMEKLKVYWKSEDLYQRLVVLELLSNQSLKEKLAKDIPHLSRPTLQIEREFFRELLRSGDAPEFALYHLIRLGDLDHQALWWQALEGGL